MKIHQFDTSYGHHKLIHTFESIEELLQYMNARIISVTLNDEVIDTYPRYNIDNDMGKFSAERNKEYILEIESDTEDINKQIIYAFSYLLEFPNNKITYDYIYEIPGWDFYIVPGETWSIRDLINALNGPVEIEKDFVKTVTKVKNITNYETKFCIIKNS